MNGSDGKPFKTRDGGVMRLNDLLSIVKTECLSSGLVIIYAYTNLINDYVEVDNKKVNIQIANIEDCSVIGWPLILGSF